MTTKADAEGSPSEIDGHPVVVLDMRRDETVAFEGRSELWRCRGEPLYAIRRIAVGGAHRLARPRGRDDDRRRREHVVAGRMISMRLGVDDETHRHRGEIPDCRPDVARLVRVLSGIDHDDTVLCEDDTAVRLEAPSGMDVDAIGEFLDLRTKVLSARGADERT